MKVKRISKNAIKYFFAAAILTALVIMFAAAFVTVEKNTSAIGLTEVSTMLEVDISGSGATVTVNDRSLKLSLSRIYQMMSSRAVYAGLSVWLLL